MRAAFWAGYRLLRVWWQIRRPLHRGALVAVWAEGRLLLLRQSYQPRAAFPGGGVHKHEAPSDAARRELMEELALPVEPSALAFFGETTQRWDGRRDTVAFFELTLAAIPALLPDRREIRSAAFYPPEALPPRLSKPVAHYLRWRLQRAQPEMSGRSASGNPLSSSRNCRLSSSERNDVP